MCTHVDKFEIGKVYEVLEQFDAYFCMVGRVTVNPGAQFQYTYDKRVFFINSRNYLPADAQNTFMHYAVIKEINGGRK